MNRLSRVKPDLIGHVNQSAALKQILTTNPILNLSVALVEHPDAVVNL